MSQDQPSVEIDRLLHEPARLQTLVQLAAVSRADFTWLLNQTGLTRGNLSVQMSKLAEAGVVEVEKRFNNNRPQTLYSLTPAGRKALMAYKQVMQQLLEQLPG
jgi:DNA-binding MarR family transcriptional regulator